MRSTDFLNNKGSDLLEDVLDLILVVTFALNVEQTMDHVVLFFRHDKWRLLGVLIVP